MEGQSSTAAVNALQTSEHELLYLASTTVNDSPKDAEPECPLKGAYYDTIDHFNVSITTLELTQEYFTEFDQGIVEFADWITKKNDEAIRLDERMVNHLYSTQVLDLWSFQSPMAEKLLAQVGFFRDRILDRLHC